MASKEAEVGGWGKGVEALIAWAYSPTCLKLNSNKDDGPWKGGETCSLQSSLMLYQHSSKLHRRPQRSTNILWCSINTFESYAKTWIQDKIPLEKID
jgi:hypothetical protein